MAMADLHLRDPIGFPVRNRRNLFAFDRFTFSNNIANIYASNTQAAGKQIELRSRPNDPPFDANIEHTLIDGKNQ